MSSVEIFDTFGVEFCVGRKVRVQFQFFIYSHSVRTAPFVDDIEFSPM